MKKLNPKHNILKGEAPEVGNPVHIKKLHDHERYEMEFYRSDVELGRRNRVKANARVHIYFICPECGNHDVCITINMDDIIEQEISISDSEENGKCNFCNSEYAYTDGILEVVANPLHPEKLKKEEEEI